LLPPATYSSAHPKGGLAAVLANLGGALAAACSPSSTPACLIDSVLANNGNMVRTGESGSLSTTGTAAKWSERRMHHARGACRYQSDRGSRLLCGGRFGGAGRSGRGRLQRGGGCSHLQPTASVAGQARLNKPQSAGSFPWRFVRQCAGVGPSATTRRPRDRPHRIRSRKAARCPSR